MTIMIIFIALSLYTWDECRGCLIFFFFFFLLDCSKVLPQFTQVCIFFAQSVSLHRSELEMFTPKSNCQIMLVLWMKTYKGNFTLTCGEAAIDKNSLKLPNSIEKPLPLSLQNRALVLHQSCDTYKLLLFFTLANR